MIRGFLIGTLFASAMFGPWWLFVIPAIFVCVRWQAYEVVLAGLLMDLTYMPFSGLFGVPFINTLLSLAILGVFWPIRNRLSVNAEVFRD